ncbi:MAG: helix-turn-helix domain-containing protein [Eubacterium sp.]|nr:helix-turn-helix domain-containing protein [Eubacterium sp.]
MTIDVKVTYKNDKLKALRKAAGLSQAQLGEMTGLNFRTLQHYEQGTKDLNAAKLQTLLKLCNVLGCTLSDIITDPETIELLDAYKEKH